MNLQILFKLYYQVDTDCIITDTRKELDDVRGKNCNKLDVSNYSSGSYPSVEVKYSWEMCNKNDFDIELRDKKAKFFDWTRTKGSKQENVRDPRIALGGKTLAKGQCLNESRTIILDTTNRYTIASQLEGYVVDPSTGMNKDAETGECPQYSVIKWFSPFWLLLLIERCSMH